MRSLARTTAEYAGRLAQWAACHRGVVAAGLLVLGGVLALLAPRLRVDPSLRHMLPEELPSQRALREAELRVPLASPLFVAVSSRDPHRTGRVAQVLAARLRGWERARSVTDRRDPSFFLDRRLLYVPASLLEELAEALEARLDWEQCARIPGCFNLEEEAPAVPVEQLERFFLEDRRIAGLLRLLGERPERLLARAREPARSEGSGSTPEPSVSGRLCTKGGRTCVLQVLLRTSGSDVERSAALLEEVRVLLLRSLREELGWEDVRPRGFDLLEASSRGVKIQVRGRIRNLVASRDALRADLRATSLLASLLVFFVLLWQFRSGRMLLLLFGPMVLGFVCTLGVLLLGGVRLNLVSAATLSVLVGIGIDFGIHLTICHVELLDEAPDVGRAVRETWRRLGGALLAAALTTAVGFGALLGTTFRGFAQMGLVALLGVLSVFVAYLMAHPLLAGMLGPGVARRGRRRGRAVGAWRPWLGGVPVAVLGLVALGGGALLAPRLGYETDYRKLQPSVRGRFAYARALHGTERTPILVLADDEVQLRRAVAQLRAEHPDGIDGEGPGWLLSADLFVPEEQARKLRAIARMRAATEELLRHARGRERARLRAILPWLRVETAISTDALPRWVHDLLADHTGRIGTFAIAYARMRTTDTSQMQRLAAQIERWRARYTVRFASFGAMLGEVQASLQADTPRVLVVALLGLLLVTAVVGRSLVRAAWVTAALAVSVGLAIVLLVLSGTRPNLYNVPVLPVVFGLGVDGAIYVTWRLWRRREASVPFEAFPSVRRAVWGATGTTLAAFVALNQAASPGLQTMGRMATIALLATLFANLLWLPAAMALMRPGPPGPSRGRRG